MGGKKILLALVVIAAAATGYVLIGDNKTNSTGLQNIQQSNLSNSAASEPAATADSSTATTTASAADATSTEPAQTSQPAEPTDNSTNSTPTPMALDIKTTQPGTGDAVVKAGSDVTVLYTGMLQDGTVFDASSKHGNQPFDFTVGQGMVIKGWDQGLLGAKVGEKRTLTIPGDLAYGAQGIPGTIPPNATLIFDVQVVSIK